MEGEQKSRSQVIDKVGAKPHSIHTQNSIMESQMTLSKLLSKVRISNAVTCRLLISVNHTTWRHTKLFSYLLLQ